MRRARLFIIGRGIGYTLSPVIYTKALSGLVDLEYGVVDARTIDEALEAVEECRRTIHCLGFNVTKPYKLEIIPHLDRLEGEASEIGAVNTVAKRDTSLIGYNTDWYGVIEPLRLHGYRGAEEALIIGAGGAARAAVYALRGTVKRVYITSRSGVTAVKLAAYAEKLGMEAVAGRARPEFYELIAPRLGLLINASPASTATSSPIPPRLIPRLPEGAIVMDMVYNPPETRLIKEARSHGYTVVDGLWMLSYQASLNIEIWFGLTVSPQRLRGYALEALSGGAAM